MDIAKLGGTTTPTLSPLREGTDEHRSIGEPELRNTRLQCDGGLNNPAR